MDCVEWDFGRGSRRSLPAVRALQCVVMIGPLPPTSLSLMEGSHRPYFLWWGMLFTNSGYVNAGGMPGNVLLAFSVDGK